MEDDLAISGVLGFEGLVSFDGFRLQVNQPVVCREWFVFPVYKANQIRGKILAVFLKT